MLPPTHVATLHLTPLVQIEGCEGYQATPWVPMRSNGPLTEIIDRSCSLPIIIPASTPFLFFFLILFSPVFFYFLFLFHFFVTQGTPNMNKMSFAFILNPPLPSPSLVSINTAQGHHYQQLSHQQQYYYLRPHLHFQQNPHPSEQIKVDYFSILNSFEAARSTKPSKNSSSISPPQSSNPSSSRLPSISPLNSESMKAKAEGEGGEGEGSKKSPPGRKKEKRRKEEVKAGEFHCNHCGVVFDRIDHFKRHSKMHTGERPHACKFPGCYCRFGRRDNMVHHFSTHFPQEVREEAENLRNKLFKEATLPSNSLDGEVGLTQKRIIGRKVFDFLISKLNSKIVM